MAFRLRQKGKGEFIGSFKNRAEGLFNYRKIIRNFEQRRPGDRYYGGSRLPESLPDYRSGAISKEISKVDPTPPTATPSVKMVDGAFEFRDIEGGIPGVRGLRKVGLGPQPERKIIRKESVLLRKKLRDEARGARVGSQFARRELMARR